MFKIQTLNNISPIIHESLSADMYTVSNEEPTPDAILVRSAAMHDMALPDSLLAIARAGAGVNNIPIDKCSEQGIVVFNTPGANANAVAELVMAGLKRKRASSSAPSCGIRSWPSSAWAPSARWWPTPRPRASACRWPATTPISPWPTPGP